MIRLLKATLCLLLCAAPLLGGHLPDIPSSAAVLSLVDVKEYWVYIALSAPLTPEASSFHTEQNAARAQSIAARQRLIERVRCGALDTEARLVQLQHNAAAWETRGNPTEAARVEAQRRKLVEHLARLETLEAQRAAAVAQQQSADSLKRLECQIATLRAGCR